MSVLDYYKNNKFNPVPIKFSKKKNIIDHYIKRFNLIENHLNIFLPLLNNKKILEFGCNGGENACFLADYGANLYLVEPHKKVHKIILNNFNKINKKKNLKLLSSKTLEDFNTKEKFDVIIAEGFLNTLNKRDYYFKKIISFLKPGGLLIINYDDVYGGFFEFLKSYILFKSCYKNNIKPDSEKGLRIAEKLFKREFNKLNKSRTFYSWWKDQLINPYAAKTWSLQDLIKLANTESMSCYSTSPIFNKSSLLKWYKNIDPKDLNPKKINQVFIEEWKKNLLNFLIGHDIGTPINLSDKELSQLKYFINKMNLSFKNKNLDKKIKINKTVNKIFYYNRMKSYRKEFLDIIKLLNSSTNNINKIIKYYTKSKKLKKTWGNLLHYVVFKKNFN